MEFKRGDSNRITRDYFESILLEMHLIDSVIANSELTLYNKTFKTPVMTAALSHLGNVRKNGMVEMAMGATQAGAVTWAGMGEMEEMDEMVQTGASVVKIIKPYQDNDEIIRRIKKAEDGGAFAVGMDIDHAFTSAGEYDEIHGLAMRPKTKAELQSFVNATQLPFIIKGVLSREDAAKCLDIGVQGLLISHHHGIMDYAVPPLKILPEIFKETKGNIPLFVDCGIESGMDVYKCLALGATAVCAGRIIMDPLKENGHIGVMNTIESMTSELKGAMSRTGASKLSEINSSVLWTLQGKYDS